MRRARAAGRRDGKPRQWLGTFSRTIEARRVHLTFNHNKWNYATTNAVEMNAIIAGQ